MLCLLIHACCLIYKGPHGNSANHLSVQLLQLLLELLLKNVHKYFQLPNHSSLPELPFKRDFYQYFQNPKPQ